MAKKKDESTERTIELLPHQYDFLTSEEKYVYFKAGLGAGKTDAGSNFVIQMVTEQPKETLGFVGAQSHRQLYNAVFPHLKRAFDKAGMKYEWNEGKNFFIVNDRKVIYNTLDEGSIESIMGSEIGWFLIDEYPYCPEYAVKLVKSRLRCPRATRLLGRFLGSPNGFNHAYETFVVNADAEHKMISATTYDNHFLPPSYAADLKKQYTPLEFRQQVLGEFVNLSGGQIYDCFDESKHLVTFDHAKIDSKIYIGLDFNVSQMNAVCCKYVDNKLYVFDEIHLKNSNTIGMAKEIMRRFPNYARDIFIIPDSTFDTRSVTSEKTSKEILRNLKFQIMPTRNPYIGERQNALNAAFWNEGGEPRVLIHPKCSNLRKELNTLTADDKEGEDSHLAVALGYCMWKLCPLRRPRRPSRVL